MTHSPITRRRWLGHGLGLAATVAAPQTFAQSFPQKPVRILVGYSAGGGVDAMARLLAQGLSGVWGQQVVVDNRAGASGLIAAEAVSRSAADGHTLLLGESGLFIAHMLQPRASLDPAKAFVPVAGLFTSPLMVVGSMGFPAHHPQSLLDELKAHPGRYAYATSGVGTVQHLGFEMLKGRSGTFVVHIPYRGAAQILPDVVGGQVPLGVVSATAGLAQARAGKVKALAMMSNVRLPGAEQVAPLSDALPGFQVAPRLCLLAPAATPAGLVDSLSEAVRVVLESPDTVASALRQGAVPAYVSAKGMATDLPRELQEWAGIIRTQKIGDV
jgi:tripartite-type tricarboxylate transporter receptor subunit TctC